MEKQTLQFTSEPNCENKKLQFKSRPNVEKQIVV